MTEQTDPIVDAIPTEMREDYTRLGEGIASFDEQIDALQKQRRVLLDERQAILDMAAEDASDDARLVTLRNSGDLAAKRMDDAVRTVSPLMYTYIEFSPTDSYTDRHPGPYLSLMNHRERPVADVDPADVAAALVEFARRFCPQPPQEGQYPGMVCADILTEQDSLTVYYAPDGSEAVLIGARGIGRDEPARLAEVAVAVVREAQRRARREETEDY